MEPKKLSRGDPMVAQWIALRRKALGLTQQQLADRLFCAARVIGYYEQSEQPRRPSKQHAQDLPQALEIPLHDHAAFTKWFRDLEMDANWRPAPPDKRYPWPNEQSKYKSWDTYQKAKRGGENDSEAVRHVDTATPAAQGPATESRAHSQASSSAPNTGDYVSTFDIDTADDTSIADSMGTLPQINRPVYAVPTDEPAPSAEQRPRKTQHWPGVLAASAIALVVALAFTGLAIVTGRRSVGQLEIARYGHAAVELTNQDVLVTGGRNNDLYLSSAEVYNSATRSWTSLPDMSAPRFGHSATLLDDGEVLVIGGRTQVTEALTTTELYNPITKTWSEGPEMEWPRFGHTATKLKSGEVLVVGGSSSASGPGLKSAELYSPRTNRITRVFNEMSTGRRSHTATLLQSGKVLVAGGGDPIQRTLASAETYDPMSDPAHGRWVSTHNQMNSRHDTHTATLLDSGKVLIVGGWNNDQETAAVDLYDPRTDQWVPVSHLSGARNVHTATKLKNGQVLVIGGWRTRTGGDPAFSSALASAELYSETEGWRPLPYTLSSARGRHTATILENGDVLVVGGTNAKTGTGLANVEIFHSLTE